MKTGKVLLVGLLLALVLSACGGGSGSGDPVGVVEKVVTAMETLDVEEATKYICEAHQDDLDMESAFAELEALGMDPEELLSAFRINMNDVKYEEKSQADDKAVVNVSGKVSLDIDADKLRDVVKKMAEASGEEVSDADLDMLVGIFTAMSGQESSFDGDVELIKEDGDWKVCDDLDFLGDQLDLGF